MDDQKMSLIHHLNEFRKRILIVLASFVVFLVIGFIFSRNIYAWFMRGVSFHLTVLGPGEIVWIYFTLASLVALIGTIPILALQIWLFVSPALTPKEKKLTLLYVPALFLLFILGLCFGYFVIFPTIIQYLMKLGTGMFTMSFTTEKYFHFILQLTLPFGILFEIPMVMLFLTSLGLIDPMKLRKLRKYAYFVLVIIAAVITPPDFLSELVALVPLILLYELSVILSGFVYRKKIRKNMQATNLV